MPLSWPKTIKNKDATTTHDKKCGKVTVICTNFLKNLILSSLISNATKTADKKEITILTDPIIIVFLNAGQKSGYLKMNVKFFQPTQFSATDPKIPLLGEKYVNAMRIPYIGI